LGPYWSKFGLEVKKIKILSIAKEAQGKELAFHSKKTHPFSFRIMSSSFISTLK
jgi:hypothetical protein